MNGWEGTAFTGPQKLLNACATVEERRFSVQNGDPMSSGFVILAKATTGCVVPWHWHSANEQLMMVTGSAKIGMKDAAPASLPPDT